MSEVIKTTSLAEFHKLLKVHIKKKTRDYNSAIKKAARVGVHIVRGHAPKAFNELRESVHQKDKSIIVDAPHAVPVEIGSRPHYVPLENLIKWVRLRNLQGKRPGQLKKRESHKIGSTTLRQALTVRGRVKQLKRGGSSEEEAIISVAKAIQSAILREGTQPHRFVLKALPDLGDSLLHFLKEANDKPIGV